MKHTKHYWRASFLIIGAFLAFLIVRAFLIPASFGKYGFYRADNVQEQMNKPVSFAKRGTCGNCHDKIVQVHTKAKHQSVQCQNCHAPLVLHVKNDDFVGEMPIKRSPKMCLRCHRKLPSRPLDFPQIDSKDHLGVAEQLLPIGECIKCHHPHDPSPNRGNREELKE